MATKKTFLEKKAKTPAKLLLKKGDAVLVRTEAGSVIGIFVAYSKRDRVVTLEWPKELRCGFPGLYLWPESSVSFYNVNPDHISVLSPVEILSELSSVIRYRDERISRIATGAIVDSVKNPLYPGI